MNKQDINDIENFLDEELMDYSIKYDYEIEDDVAEVTIKDVFLEGDVEFSFKVVSGNVEFYALSESWIEAETRQFWIDLMFKLLGK